ncbi:peptidase [Pseudoxanthomonas sp. z9]|uniref:peptidase n=1 Tax=Pseudoxanthomonas sp. z9 TaxID=2584942 RepID=UPI001142D06C|nr:peptidase [Pseudoxanthomonas sp. z9]
MFMSLSRYVKDARTLAKLCSRAEEIARDHGHARPGSEHFVLAALGLADKTASEAFGHLALTEAAFLGALASQHEAALASIGVARPAVSAGPPAQTRVAPKGSLYEAGPSGQSLVQRLAESRGARKGRELLGADVLLGVAQEVHTSAARAFRGLGISAEQMADAASAAMAGHAARAGAG